MKYLNLILILVTLFSCKKETSETSNIEYPKNGAYGTNILFGVDTLRVTEENNSFRAIIPEGGSLKIELKLMGGETWFYANEQNWIVSDFSDSTQTFTSLSNGISDLELTNADTMNVDTVLIKYFENGNKETKRKILIRE